MNSLARRWAGNALAATILGLCAIASAAQEPEEAQTIPYLPSASDAPGRLGIVRVINYSDESGEVSITAIDDEGQSYGPATLSIDAGESMQFNSGDLESGNAEKGLSDGVGAGEGAWRLELTSGLDIEVLSYVRSADGVLAAIHDTVPHEDGRHHVVFFNPGSNTARWSRLRLVNPGEAAAEVSITGVDARGESPGSEVTTTIPAGAARTFASAVLESGGEGLEGALGDGEGKWRLTVDSEQPLVVMSLLVDAMGRLTNLSTAPGRELLDAPDLVVASPAVSDDSPVAGATFTLSVTVRNDGQRDSAATTLSYYRSSDATLTTSDTEVGTVAVGALSASASRDYSIDVAAPAEAGVYYYGACVDAVTDESETISSCSSSVRVTVRSSVTPVQGQPDLVVGTPTVGDASVETGGSFTLSATVSNTGDSEAPATTLRYYWSTDQMVTTTHTEVGTDDVGALAATGTSEESISLTARRSMGRYFYGACVDAVANESDTTNNCSAPVTVEVNEPQQPEGLPSVGLSRVSSSVTEGMPARYTVTATPPPTADLVVNLQYIEFASVGGRLIYYNWPPTETTVTITGGSSSTPLTVPTIDDSDADGDSVIHAEVTSGSGYTIDTDPHKRVVYVGVVDDD